MADRASLESSSGEALFELASRYGIDVSSKKRDEVTEAILDHVEKHGPSDQEEEARGGRKVRKKSGPTSQAGPAEVAPVVGKSSHPEQPTAARGTRTEQPSMDGLSQFMAQMRQAQQEMLRQQQLFIADVSALQCSEEAARRVIEPVAEIRPPATGRERRALFCRHPAPLQPGKDG